MFAEEPWPMLKPVPPKVQPEEDPISTLGRGPVGPTGFRLHRGGTVCVTAGVYERGDRNKSEIFAEAQC